MKNLQTNLDVTRKIAEIVNRHSGKMPWGVGSEIERDVSNLIACVCFRLVDHERNAEVGFPKSIDSTGPKIVTWLFDLSCKCNFHCWNERWLDSEMATYHMRKCDNCKIEQIRHIGPIGDGKWHPLGNWKNDWEKEDFLSAK